ncbi:MAG: hypothetical protein A2297_05545 [Elusimicrobia bacterium RIFOXYB2_FULL_48_7]|nr:MAG: hypothetical protein A2297_05545 [Elusimicrobia bacterium RIFOXYB2_FULL_48_7]
MGKKNEPLSSRQIILIAAAFCIAVAIFFSWRSSIVSSITSKKNINFMIVGTDFVDHSLHSDTLIFVSYNPRSKFIDIISIPRDTKVSIPGINVNRINEVYAFYYKKEKSHIASLEALRKVVGMVFLNRIELPHYFQVDYTAFRKLIDAVGGIQIDIEEPMKYDDNAGNLHINFTPGPWLLYGDRAVDLTTKKEYPKQGALEYVRFRTSAGDIGRIYRQQRFVEALINRFKNPLIILRIPRLLKCVMESPHTDLNFYDILTLMLELKKADFSNLRKAQLPGKFFYNYWLKDDEEIAKVLDLVYGSGTEYNQSKITVEVLNASQSPGIALEVTRKLRDNGFDVINYQNCPTKSKKTTVIDRIGNLRAAQQVAGLMLTEEIFTRYDSKRLVDISVYIGEDYREKVPKEQTE